MTPRPRHHRQMILDMVGVDGQARLRDGHAIIIGCGALGCAAADALTRAGVGLITIVDRDVVDLTNLQRQTLFTAADAQAGLPKPIAAQRRLRDIDPDVRVRAICDDVTPSNAERLLRGEAALDADAASRADVIVDGTDSFETRYLLNDVAVKLMTPMVYAGVVATQATQMTVLPAGEDAPWPEPTPCLRCVAPTPPEPGTTPTCDTAGVLGPAAQIAGAIQASEAIKILVGRYDLIAPGLLAIDLFDGRFRRLDVGMPLDGCVCCDRRTFEFLDAPAEERAVTLCGADAVQIAAPPGDARVDLDALARRLAPHGSFHVAPFILRGELHDERGPDDALIGLTIFPSGRAIITGEPRPERARSIYARYVGA